MSNNNNNNNKSTNNNNRTQFSNNNNNRNNNNYNNRRNNNHNSNNKNRNNNRKDNNNNNNRPSTKFIGSCDDIKGHIYDYSSINKNTDQYGKTTHAIADYVGRTYKYGGDVKMCLTKLEQIVIDVPTQPEGNDAVLKSIFNAEITEHVKRKCFLRENLKSAYTLIWGQCTDFLKAKLEALKTFDGIETKQCPIDLLKAIKSIIYNYEEHKYIYSAVYEAYKAFYNMRQQAGVTNSEYLEQFKNVVDVLEQHGGSLGHDTVFLENDEEFAILSDAEKEDKDTLKAIKKTFRDMYIGCTFIYKSDQERYSKLKEDLHNDYMKGSDNYPENLVDAFGMLTNYKLPTSRGGNAKSTGVAFSQKGKKNSNNNRGNNNNNNNTNSNNNNAKDVECFNCKQKGNFARNCPNKSNTSNTNVSNDANGNNNSNKSVKFNLNNNEVQLFNIMSNNTSVGISNFNGQDNLKKWILLDNQSTTDIFCNGDYLNNIQDTDETMTVYTNGGSITTSKKGFLKGYGKVWYHPDAITNILSMSNVKKQFRVTYDSDSVDRFTIQKPDREVHFN